MPRRDTEAWEATNRQRVNDQIDLVRRGNTLGVTERSTGEPENLPIMTVPNTVIIEGGRGRGKNLSDLEALLNNPEGPFATSGRPADKPIQSVIGGVLVYELPKLKAKRPKVQPADVVLDKLPGVARPEYYLHVSADHGRPCPATEPEETGLAHPWPAVTAANPNAGQGVKVTIVDTGWWPQAATRHSWLAQDVGGDQEPIGANLNAYSGHGTFIAGVVRCRAPKAEIRHERFEILLPPGGQNADYQGAVRESAIIRQLRQALRKHAGDPRPHVINLSAGSYTLDKKELSTFVALGQEIAKHGRTVLVAAAGNEATDLAFYPAASDWTVGVGSLDRKGGVSNFSNFGVNADVYCVGRNHVNAYPDGKYRCRETPDKDDERIFKTGLARWSGTSFSAPLVAGLIAAEFSRKPQSTAKQATDRVLNIPKEQVPDYGKIKRLLPDYA